MENNVILRAMQSRRLSTMNIDFTRTLIQEILIENSKDEYDPEKLYNRADQFAKFIRANFSNMTERELKIIIESGSDGKFGNHGSVNIAVLMEWADKYAGYKKKALAEMEDSKISMPDRISFLVRNIQHLPSLAKLLNKHESNRTNTTH